MKKSLSRPITFELTLRDGRPLFTIVMRPSYMWTFIAYWNDGSVRESIEVAANEFMELVEKLKRNEDEETPN
jgi:hypothetical protein